MLNLLLFKTPFAGARTYILCLIGFCFAVGIAVFTRRYALSLVLASVSTMLFYLRVSITMLMLRLNDVAEKVGIDLKGKDGA